MDYSSDSSSNYSNLSTEKSSGSTEASIKTCPKTPYIQNNNRSLSSPKKFFDVLSFADCTITTGTEYPKTSDTEEILDTASISTVRNDTTTITEPVDNKQIKEKIVKTQYEICHILKGISFTKRFIQKCRQHNVCGYVVFLDDEIRTAFGEMEGTVEDINEVKNFLYSSCLPEPFVYRAKFSAYERERYPKKIQFAQARIVNVNEDATKKKKVRIDDTDSNIHESGRVTSLNSDSL